MNLFVTCLNSVAATLSDPEDIFLLELADVSEVGYAVTHRLTEIMNLKTSSSGISL